MALPNNRVRVTHPASFETGEGPPDFKPTQHIHYSKSDLDYVLDVNQIFDNIRRRIGKGIKWIPGRGWKKVSKKVPKWS